MVDTVKTKTTTLSLLETIGFKGFFKINLKNTPDECSTDPACTGDDPD